MVSVRILLASTLACTPVMAQDWTQFGIQRFGFRFDVPSEYRLTDRYKDEEGDGALFLSPDKDLLAVWGVNLEQQSFRQSIEDQIRQDEQDGWIFTYKRLTPKWAAYSGIRDGKI